MKGKNAIKLNIMDAILSHIMKILLIKWLIEKNRKMVTTKIRISCLIFSSAEIYHCFSKYLLDEKRGELTYFILTSTKNLPYTHKISLRRTR